MKETTMAWQRSSSCSAGACVEVAECDGGILLRDSKNPHLPPLFFTRAEWNDFQDMVKRVYADL